MSDPGVTPDDPEIIGSIAAEAQHADGAAPLDEATWLTLRHHPEQVRWWVRDHGFALLIGSDLSLVVRPDHRGRGTGTQLLDLVLAEAAGGATGSTGAAGAEAAGGLSAWSHGDHPAASRLAAAYGFERVRELWVMRLDVSAGLPPVAARPGVSVRGYQPTDEAELLRVNAAAFAAHPEQGAMDAANLAERMGEAWFDPAGLLVAVPDDEPGRMLGFHWTKRHSSELGEVYVVGIDPAAQGGGLGKLLTLAGLHHLADGGAREVLLYVESDNAPAVAVYSGLGFTHAPEDTHVRYQRAGR